MNNRGLEASTDATEYPRPHGLRLKSILHVLSVLVLITVFSGGRAAFALGSEPTDLNVIDTMNALDAGFSVIEGAASPSLPRHTIPDDLPPLVSQKMTSNIKHSDPSILAQHAQEQQVLLHYAHRNLDLAPRFHAKQNKKHAAMTGRSQLLILAIAFLLMSGVTITLWRQLGNLVPTAPRNRVGPPRRLR